MQNLFVVIYYAQKIFILFNGLKKKKKNHFLFSKSSINYANIDRKGSLDADFQQVPFFFFFFVFFFQNI